MLSAQQRSFILNDQIVGPAIINFALNGLDGWMLYKHFTPVPMWALPGVAFELLSVLPGLPFIICLITTPFVRRAVRKNKVAPLTYGPNAYPLLRRLPAHNGWRATVLGIGALLLVGPPLMLGLWISGYEQIGLWPFVILKGVVCAILAAMVSPIAALYVLAQVRERGQKLELEPASDQPCAA